MEAKGDQLMHEAEAGLKKFSFGALFGGGQEKYEEASEKFKRAANTYKASKCWSGAAKAFTRAAECYKQLKDEMEITSCYTEAAKMMVKAGNAAEASALIEAEALPRMIDAGRLAQAAKLHEEVAKIFEDEHEYQQAIDNYTKAADLFSAENSAATASKAKQNAARLYAMLEPADYQKCCELYAECGAEAMASQLLKFGAKECFTRAVFCCLALNDAVTAKQNFDKFKEQDYTLEGSREGKLLTDLITAFQNQDADAFADSLFNYNQISSLDNWKIAVLKVAKDHLTGGGEGGGGGGGGGGGEGGSTL